MLLNLGEMCQSYPTMLFGLGRKDESDFSSTDALSAAATTGAGLGGEEGEEGGGGGGGLTKA